MAYLIECYDYATEFTHLNDAIFLTYDEFIKYYSLNPNRWELKYDEITVFKGATHTRLKINDYYSIGFETISDALQYKNFYNDKEERKKILRQNACMADFLEMMQNDINDLRRKANMEIEEATRKLTMR
jgi:hypothetical protein